MFSNVYRPQHLKGLQLVTHLCNGMLSGNAIGSTEVSLTPVKIKGGDYLADTGTAG